MSFSLWLVNHENSEKYSSVFDRLIQSPLINTMPLSLTQQTATEKEIKNKSGCMIACADCTVSRVNY